MAVETRKSLEEYVGLEYPMTIIASRDGGYVVVFPDLPGCVTQADTLAEVPEMAEEARLLWIEAEYEDGRNIPLPSYPEEYSGKFNVRLPKSLHRRLAEGAERQSVSLNQYVVDLLAQGGAETRAEHRIEALEHHLIERFEHLTDQVKQLKFPITQMPFASDRSVRISSGKKSRQHQPYPVVA